MTAEPEKLVTRENRCSPQPFERIQKAFSQRLRVYLRSRVSNEEDVEDLLQTIWIKFMTHADSIRTESAITGWLYRVAGNTVTDFYRQRGRAEALASGELWHAVPEQTATH